MKYDNFLMCANYFALSAQEKGKNDELVTMCTVFWLVLVLISARRLDDFGQEVC